jgi:hypothetical protein
MAFRDIVKHLKYLFWHKVYVFRAGIERGAPVWQLINHDWSKFYPSEFIPYTRHFFPSPNHSGFCKGKDSPTYPEFCLAFRLHCKRNAHHWEHWCKWNGDGWHDPQPIPDNYRREMLADWDGTGLSKGGVNNTVEWYLANWEIINLHPDTRRWVEEQLGLL